MPLRRRPFADDTNLLNGGLRPRVIFLNEVQGFMNEEDQTEVRARALEMICAYRDRGCVLPAPPQPETVHQMMEVLMAGDIPDEYAP